MERKIQCLHHPVDFGELFMRWSQHRLSDRANLKQNRWLPVLAYIFVIWLAHSTSISTDVSLQSRLCLFPLIQSL